ncbi:MAG: hypothetical protein IJQ80_02470 [Clostridia bacterium]|nr:hypothetical protein [Clostridia bacterium]
MVKKLIKYDLKAFAKVMIPIEAVLLGAATLFRIIQFFESDTVFYKIFAVSTGIIFGLSVAAGIILTAIVSIVRFYKNLFTAEGYLSFTLPVTPSQHVASKLIVSLIFDVITALTIAVSLVIATSGDMLVELVNAGLYLIRQYFSALGGHGVFFVIESVICAVTALVAFHLITFMCLTIGQLAKRHKVLLAVGVYYGLYVAGQIIGTVFIAVGTISGLFAAIGGYFVEHPIPAFHITLCVSTVISLIFCAVYYLITRALMKNKLNLT